MPIIHYDRRLKPLARKLRKRMTPGELLLWHYLRRRQVLGLRFNRQRPIGRFIVDFYCPELKFAIEVDGASHNERQDQDSARDRSLLDQGVTVLRFQEYDVHTNLEGVMEVIRYFALERLAQEHLLDSGHPPSLRLPRRSVAEAGEAPFKGG